MPYGGGLSAQFMFAAESTWGTPVTVTKAVEFNDETLNWAPTYLDSEGLKAGQAYKRASRTRISRFAVSGQFTCEAADKGLGLLLKHALGATAGPTQIAATTAYRQIHTPGIKTGLGLTVQVGRPQTDGTVRPFTYEGVKIMAVEFTVADGELAKFTFECIGQQMLTATALAAASYPTAGVWSFNEASTFTLGGTVSTASGLASVAGGVAVATVVNSITIRAESPMKDDRFGLGNAGAMSEPIENAIPTVTGSLAGEFTSRTELHDLMYANTTAALRLALTHGDAGGGNPFALDILLPACKFKENPVNVDGPDVIGQTTSFEAYDDQVNAVAQIVYVSTDTVL